VKGLIAIGIFGWIAFMVGGFMVSKWGTIYEVQSRGRGYPVTETASVCKGFNEKSFLGKVLDFDRNGLCWE